VRGHHLGVFKGPAVIEVAAFAKPEIYEALEERDVKYATY
jgi:hypothetical protein